MIDEAVTLDLITLPPSVFSVYSLFSVVKSDFNIGDIKNTENAMIRQGGPRNTLNYPEPNGKKRKKLSSQDPKMRNFLS